MTLLQTADTSAVVPSLATWHEQHDLALAAVTRVRRLPAHVVIETLSVLTRLPGGLAQPLRAALDLLRDAFPEEPLTLPGAEHLACASTLAEAGLGGGGLYDGLVGATALHHDARLLSLDSRARPVYAALGVDVRYLS